MAAIQNVIFHVTGGIGKHIAATAVCTGIQKKYPNHDLIVVSAYPEVFINNPYVSRSLGLSQTAYFYDTYIRNKDFVVLKHDPYDSDLFIHQQTHLIKAWFDILNIPYNGEKPFIYLTQREIDYNAAKLPSDKPILMMQTNGGAPQQPIKYSWARDIPSHIVQQVIDEYAGRYNILHVRRDDQIGYPNTIPVHDDFRSIACMMLKSEKRLFMDSFCQHTAAALGLSSTVLWIANKPECFGYELHHNILPTKFTNEPELRHSYLYEFNNTGDPLEFPYRSEKEIFYIQDVLKSLSGNEREEFQPANPNLKGGMAW